jgi:hypothetical protein
MKNKEQVASCVICGIEVNANETFGFAFNDEMYFFCNSHAEPFKIVWTSGLSDWTPHLRRSVV